MTWRRAVLTALGVVLLAAVGSAPAAMAAPGPSQLPASSARPVASPIPFLAYYYIWFDKSSWKRAKSDLPTLGPYSSDDAAVMRQHVRWAKAAGITGFIVSWKSSPTLDRRLRTLMQVANEEHFKLAIIYQGLDFSRRPLPIARVAADLKLFRDTFASDPVFKIFEKPLVIFSGTWAYSTSEIESATAPLRPAMLVLGSEKNVAGFDRIKTLVDGDAYYWSSVNPDTYPRYQEKLDGFATAIHGMNGLWIAPAAAGFNGTLLGGLTMVDRKDGDTLRREVNAALRSGPDAVGLISWNEFSENSQIEPSQAFGDRYLQVMGEITQLPTPSTDPLGSSDDQTGAPPLGSETIRLVVIGLLVAVILVAPLALNRARKRARRAPPS